MSAGRRDTLIAFQRAASSKDEWGEETQGWQDVGSEWAQVIYGRGDERRSAAMEQGQQPATFVVLDNSRTRSLTVRDRILFDVAWDIDSNVPSRTRGEREITAVRVS